MANYSSLKAAIGAAIKTNGNQEITGQVLQDVLTSIVSVIGANYTFAGVATPSTNPGTPDQNLTYLAMEGGTYTNFNGTVLPAGISLLMWNGTWTSETVMYGDGGVFDISVYKSSGGTLATYADLSAALDGGNNIPASARKGGMSVKYVQTSDNKYVQYRYMPDDATTVATFTNVVNWQGVDDKPTAGSDNLVKSGGVYNRVAKQEQTTLLVPWDNMMPIDGWIGNDAFQLNGGKHVVIPVKGGDVITVRSISPAFMFYIVKSYHVPTASDLTVDFATGETARRDASNRELTITLPSDAKYLVCTYTDLSNISRKPKYIFINGIDILNNTTDEIDTISVNGISSNMAGTVIAQIDKITLAALDKKLFMRKYDGTDNYYPELHFPKNTIFDIAGIKIVEDNGNFYLANKVAVLDGIISAITGNTPYKLYWHKTFGLIIKGGIDESSQEMLVLSLRGNETFLYNGYTYIVINGVLTKIGQGDSDTDYVENAMNIIQGYNEGKNLINFAFMTDTHSTNSVWNGGVPNMTFPGKSIDIMGKLSTQNLIDCCIHGGDVLTTFGAKTNFPKSNLVIAVQENAAFYKESIPGLIFVKGNHDNGHNDDAAYDLTNAEWKSYFQSSGNIPANAIWGTEQDACYYYFDNDAKKVRIIVIDSWYEPFNSETMSFGSEQEDWFYNTALHITGKADNTGWCVLVVSHYWGYSALTIEQNPLSANMNNILRAFQDKGTQYGDYIFDAGIDTKLVGVVMGHAHQDGYNNSQGYNTIRVTRGFATCNQVGMNSEMPAVDIFTIDTVSDVLYETRIGRGSSHSYEFGSNPRQIN